MIRLPIVLFLILGFAGPLAAAAEPTPSPGATLAAASPTPALEPTPVPLADVVLQADAAEAGLQEMLPAADAAAANAVGRDLPAVTREISALLTETTQLLQPGVLLETLRELELRWENLSAKLALWTRDLTARANLLDKELALLPEMQATWTRTREAAQTADTPPEIAQRIDTLLAEITQTEDALQKRRAAILTEQSRVAEQGKRVAGALGTIRAAQNAAVSQLFVRDSAPIWSAEVRANATRDLVEGSQNSFSAQFLQLRAFVRLAWTQFILLALIFSIFAFALFWVKGRAAKWTDEDPLLERANRVLQLPVATATVLTLLICRPFFEEAPRLFWTLLAALTLPPIVIILRRLVDRHLFPILNALVIFYVIAHIRRLAASLPVLSRLILLLEMIGGAIFLLWFIRSTRLPALATGTASHKATRAGARIGVALFAAVFLATALGYFRLANYLANGALVTAYLAIFFYAAAGVVSGLILFALQIRPLSGLGVVRRYRALLQRRLTRAVFLSRW